MSDSHLTGITRPSSCTSKVVSDSYKRPAALTAHLPASCTSRWTGRNGTHTAGCFHHRNTLPPASCTTEWSAPHRPTHHLPMPDIKHHTIVPITHTKSEREEHIRRAIRPLGRSLSIERSERFPHCLLEIPLATPWPKQTLRLANRTYLPVFVFPRRLQPIYYSCVCAITSTALLQPHSPTLTRTTANLPVAPVTPLSTMPAAIRGSVNHLPSLPSPPIPHQQICLHHCRDQLHISTQNPPTRQQPRVSPS